MFIPLANTILLLVLLLGSFVQASILGIGEMVPANWIMASAVLALVLVNRSFDPLLMVMILLALILITGNYIVNMPRLGLNQVKALALTAMGLLPFGICLQGLNRDVLLRVTGGILGMGLMASLVFWVLDFNLAQVVLGQKTSYAGRSLAAGFFANPNAASHFYLMSMVLSLLFIRKRLWKIVAVMLSLALIVLSFSRGSLLAAGVGLFVYWLLQPSAMDRYQGKLKAAAVSLAVIVVSVWIFAIRFPEQFTGLIHKITSSGLSYRQVLWELAWNNLTADVMTVWFGQGANTLALPLGDITATAHNSYLNTAVNLGLFYLAVTGCMIVVVMVRTWHAGDRTYTVFALPMLIIGAVSSVLFEGMYPLWIGLAWVKMVVETPGQSKMSSRVPDRRKLSCSEDYV